MKSNERTMSYSSLMFQFDYLDFAIGIYFGTMESDR